LSTPKKRLGLIVFCIFITSFSAGWIIRGFSEGGTPTVDPTPGKGLSDFSWYNATIGVRAPEFWHEDLGNYTAWVLSIEGGGGVTDHGDLTGLGDDDHSLYLLQSGVEGLTGNWDVGNYDLTAKDITSDEFYRTGIGNYSAWIESLAVGGGVTDHGALTGLSDDDHSIYVDKDGEEGLTGDWDVGNYDLTAKDITADEFYKTGIGNYTAWIESIASGTGSTGASVSTAKYIIVWNGTTSTYQAFDEWGNLDYENANFVSVHNSAVSSASSSGGGTVLLGEFTASCSSTLISGSDVWVVGSGDGSGPGKGTRLEMTVDDDVLYQMTGGSNKGLMNMKLVATGHTGNTLIDFDTTYARLSKLYLGNTDFGINCSKSTTTDNWINEMYILDFNKIGMQITDIQDTFLSDINIGTSVSGGIACINFDGGGCGAHFNNIHVWAVTFTCDYGIALGNKAGVYQFEAQWSNVEIEGSSMGVGIYATERADFNDWTNLRFKNVDCAIQDYGDHNHYHALAVRNVEYNGVEIHGDNTLIDGGWIHGSGHHGLIVTSDYQTFSPCVISDLIFTSNGLDSANTYYDIHIYHTKQVAISGGSSSGTDVLYSIYADDSDDLQINGFYAWDEEICFNSVDVDTHAVNVWNGTQGFVASGP